MDTETGYDAPRDEAEILPNLLGLVTRQEINEAEFEGFFRPQEILLNELSEKTVFDLSYILRVHSLALSHLYSFAGKPRTVNISKGGFLFPAAQFVPQILLSFEQETLREIPSHYRSTQELINQVAIVHAELLFIHPFREGNGRTARILANVMVRKEGYANLNFEEFEERRFDEYVEAVQEAATQEYSKMREVITTVFSSSIAQ